MTEAKYETHDGDDSQRFDDPVKVSWRGYARSRITEYNGEFDEGNTGDGPMSPERFRLALGRLKTRVVCVTVEEAEAVRHELASYDYRHRTWMNASMGRSLSRVVSKVDEAMSDRGYEPVIKGDQFLGYFPADEAERRQAEADRELRESQRRRQNRKDKVGEIYSRVRENSPVKSYWAHGGEAQIKFRKNVDESEADDALRLLREAGCENVRVEVEEYTESNTGFREQGDKYTVVTAVGDIPDGEWGLAG